MLVLFPLLLLHIHIITHPAVNYNKSQCNDTHKVILLAHPLNCQISPPVSVHVTPRPPYHPRQLSSARVTISCPLTNIYSQSIAKGSPINRHYPILQPQLYPPRAAYCHQTRCLKIPHHLCDNNQQLIDPPLEQKSGAQLI